MNAQRNHSSSSLPSSADFKPVTKEQERRALELMESVNSFMVRLKKTNHQSSPRPNVIEFQFSWGAENGTGGQGCHADELTLDGSTRCPISYRHRSTEWDAQARKSKRRDFRLLDCGGQYFAGGQNGAVTHILRNKQGEILMFEEFDNRV